MGFPNQVNAVQAPAFPGSFASGTAMRHSVLAGQGAFVADTGGVTIARFVWSKGGQVTSNESNIVTNVGTSNDTALGFVAREMQALIVDYLAEGSMVIPHGQPVTIFDAGDFWAKNEGGVTAERGKPVYAKLADGKIGVSQAGDGSDLTGGAVAWQKTTFVSASVAANNETVKITTVPLA